MSNPNVECPYGFTVPTTIGGLSKDTYDLFSLWVQAGFPKRDDTRFPPFDSRNGMTVISPLAWYLDIDAVFLWMDQMSQAGQGGEIYNYQSAYHELADITKPCPYGDGTETWETWGTFGESHKPIQIGDFWYRSTLEGQAGTPIVCSLWYDFVRQPSTSLTGINRIINLFEFQEIQAAAAPATIAGGGNGNGRRGKRIV